MSEYRSIFRLQNPYEDFLTKLYEKTSSGKVKWKPLKITNTSAKYILDPDKVFRSYETVQKNRKLFLIEKKIPVYDSDLDDYYENTFPELYVINDDNLETIMNQESVSKSILDSLIKIVSSKATDLNKFLDSF